MQQRLSPSTSVGPSTEGGNSTTAAARGLAQVSDHRDPTACAEAHATAKYSCCCNQRQLDEVK